MQKVLVYFFLHDLSDQSTNAIIRLTASIMKGLDDRVSFYYFFETSDLLQLNNGNAYVLPIHRKMRVIRRLNNYFGFQRIHWHDLKHRAAKAVSERFTERNFDAVLLMELEKVPIVKRLFPSSKIIYWIHGVSALCKSHYVENMKWVDHFVSPSRSVYHLLLQKILPAPLTSAFSYVPNWCESVFYKKDEDEKRQLRAEFGIAPNDLVFIYCGGTQNRKGYHIIESIITAFTGKISKKLTFILCGPDLDLGARINHNIHVVSFGSVAPSQLANLYALADFGLHPSVFYDTCPLTLLEMIYCGVLPATSDIGGIREIVGEEFPLLIQEPNNTELWIKKFSELIDMEGVERQNLSNSLLQKVKPIYSRENALATMGAIICS